MYNFFELKNQKTIVAGFGENSFVTPSSQKGDIFFEKVYDIIAKENGEIEIVEDDSGNNLGIWISRDEVVAIEFNLLDENDKS